MPSTLPNTGMQIPTPGGDQNAWGNILNASLTTIDGLLPSPSTAAEGDIPRYDANGALAVDGITAANATVAMEISTAGVVNFDKPPTIGGTSTPTALGLGIGEIRMGHGTADVTYASGETWFLCNGRALTAPQQTQFAAYVAAFGTSVPSLTNRMPKGWDGSSAIGTLGGNDSSSLSTANLPSHNHPGSNVTPVISDPGHNHSASGSFSINVTAPGGGPTSLTAGGVNTTQNIPVSVSVNGNTTGITGVNSTVNVAAEGSGTAFATVPYYCMVSFFIRMA